MAARFVEGEVLAGKYQVERVLGEGGMGVVVAARHLMLDERVALKFMQPEFAQRPEAVERFLREARAAVRIKNEHVARVADVGQLESGLPYMVMEYLEGIDLSTFLAKQGVLPVEDAVDYVIQACEALGEAHALGIVHRDLKPANLMLTTRRDGSAWIKVLDFGISKVPASESGALAMTKTTAILGSPLYMSPEQMMSTRDVDARTDIWSLGVILYELLAGSPPFLGETLTAVGIAVATQTASPVNQHRPDVPAGLEAVVAHCLQKRREDRFGTVGELVQALSAYAPSRSRGSIERARGMLDLAVPVATVAVSAPNRDASAPGAPPNQSVAGWGRTATDSSRKGGALRIALGALLVVAIAMVVAVFTFRWRSDGQAGTAAVRPPAGPAKGVARALPADTGAQTRGSASRTPPAPDGAGPPAVAVPAVAPAAASASQTIAPTPPSEKGVPPSAPARARAPAVRKREAANAGAVAAARLSPTPAPTASEKPPQPPPTTPRKSSYDDM